jgi:outer membrane protein TolC
LTYPVTIEIVRLQDARFQEALLQYQETVLRANAEVENSMVAFVKAKEEVELLGLNVANAEETAQLTMAAYEQGKVIVSVPLVALSILASQKDQHFYWQGQATTQYVSIYKGLGGGWENRVTEELVPEHIQEQMRKQADWWSFTGKRNISGQEVRPKK